MRRVDRSGSDIPESLFAGGAGSVELRNAEAHRNDTNPDKKAFKYKVYKRADVRLALEALFHGKCAYCETSYAATAPVDVEHYRPKGAVAEDDDHGGYWWLAMDWDNLLPSCIDCNRKREQKLFVISASLVELVANAKPVSRQSGKKDSFPLATGGVRATFQAMEFGEELALLLDPCRDDPDRHLAFSFDPAHPPGLVVPKGTQAERERGAVTIQTFGLNRLKLVEDRIRLLRRLEFLSDLVVELAESISELEQPGAVTALVGTPAAGVASKLRLLRDRTLAELKETAADDAPYSTMAKAWLNRFKAQLG